MYAFKNRLEYRSSGLTPISTTSGLSSSCNTHKYQQIDVYIYQCAVGSFIWKISAQFRIKPQMNVRCSIIYKIAEFCELILSLVAGGICPIRIDCSDPKEFYQQVKYIFHLSKTFSFHGRLLCWHVVIVLAWFLWFL